MPISGAVIVTTPQDIALIDARKGLAMFEKVNVPVIGIIENMSTFVCPHCGERPQIFKHGGGARTAELLGCPFLGSVPLDAAIVQGGRRAADRRDADGRTARRELRSRRRSGGLGSGEVRETVPDDLLRRS